MEGQPPNCTDCLLGVSKRNRILEYFNYNLSNLWEVLKSKSVNQTVCQQRNEYAADGFPLKSGVHWPSFYQYFGTPGSR